MTESMESNYPRDVRIKHPVINAWNEFHPDHKPKSVEILQQNRKHGVYRLESVGLNGSDVVAKRLPKESALIEHAIYSDILPKLPVKALHYYGFSKEPDSDFYWIFREYTGSGKFDQHLKTHRKLAGHWLATIHTASRNLKESTQLPHLTPKHYEKQLHLAKKHIIANMSNPKLHSNHIKILQDILPMLDTVESFWNKIEQTCQEMPYSVVQGDFVAKNFCVQITQQNSELICLDWDHAGFGVPAVDLHGWRSHPDLSIYLKEIRKAGWNFDRQEINEQVKVGNLFRCIAAIYWGSLNLAYQWIEWHMSCMMNYHTFLLQTLKLFKET